MQSPESELHGNKTSLERVIVLVGPTAVGKTETAVKLALRLPMGGEIVSADSRLFYRGMDIGTAKPTLEERHGVAHHLMDIADPDEPLSLAVFQHLARQAIAEIRARGRLPILVGGTGQYIRAVTQGWEVPPVQPDPRLRAALEAWVGQVGKDGLHARLAVLDPAAAAAIDARNVRRTVRALEVILTTGRRFSVQRSSVPPEYAPLVIGLSRPREVLYQRIDRRIDAMLQAGLEEEVRALLANGYSPELPTLSAIGYQEMIAYLMGKISLDVAVAEMKRRTRIFVRRQANWFKPDDPQIHWYPAGEEYLGEIEQAVQAWLSNHLTY